MKQERRREDMAKQSAKTVMVNIHPTVSMVESGISSQPNAETFFVDGDAYVIPYDTEVEVPVEIADRLYETGRIKRKTW